MFKFLLPKGSTYIFHMRGGHSIRATHVKELEMRSSNDGHFAAYSIKWVEGRQPEFFSLSIPDIVAVTAES